MANEKNLIPTTQRSESETREMGRKGGVKSGTVRLRKKRGRELMKALLSLKEIDPEKVAELAEMWGITPEEMSKEVEMNLKQIEKAINQGDTQAFKAVHQVAGTLDEEGNTGMKVVINVSKEASVAAEKWCK